MTRSWAKPAVSRIVARGSASDGRSTGIEARIIQIRDDPIANWSDDLVVPDGEIGEIVVAGPIVTREYFNRPEATRLAKIADPARNRFFHRMGDVGYLDDQGRLWFCGRKSHRVILAGETLFTIPCEAIFNTHPAVARTALVGVNRRGQVDSRHLRRVRRARLANVACSNGNV